MQHMKTYEHLCGADIDLGVQWPCALRTLTVRVTREHGNFCVEEWASHPYRNQLGICDAEMEKIFCPIKPLNIKRLKPHYRYHTPNNKRRFVNRGS